MRFATAGAREVRLDDGEAVLGGGNCFLEPFGEFPNLFGGHLVLRLPGPRDVCDPLMEALRSLSRHLCDAVGDLLFGLAGELLDSLLELPGESLGRPLA